MSFGPVDLWLSASLREQNFDWLDEPPRRRNKVKRLFVRVLLQDIKSQQFKTKLNAVYPKELDKSRKLSDLRQHWATSKFSNTYKLALLRFDKNTYIFRSFSFDRKATAKELAEMMTPRLREAIKVAKKKVVQPLSLREQEDLLTGVIKDLRPRLYTFTRRKQTFIVNSHHLSHDDMVNDLLCKVIEVARWYYPFRTYQHMIHSCYQAASRYGINQIKWYNAKKRQRLVSDGSTGFFNREIAETAEFLNDHSTTEDESQMMQDLFYQDLLNHFKPGTEQDIVRLFLGMPHEPVVNKYLDWVIEQKEHSCETVQDLREADVHRGYLTEFLAADTFQVGHVYALLERFAHQIRDG